MTFRDDLEPGLTEPLLPASEGYAEIEESATVTCNKFSWVLVIVLHRRLSEYSIWGLRP